MTLYQYTQPSIGNFYFVGQRIMHLDDIECEEYELLLRTKKSELFPVQEHNFFVQQQGRAYYSYMQRVTELVTSILTENHNIQLSLNLDLEQLQSKSTSEILTRIPKVLRSRVTLEITEHVSSKFIDSTVLIGISSLKRLKNLGYSIALDDVLNGNNLFINIERVLPIIYRIKVSYFQLLKNYSTINKALAELDKLYQLTHSNKIELVLEGIESQELSLLIKDKGIILQQGYLFDRQVSKENKKRVSNEDFKHFVFF